MALRSPVFDVTSHPVTKCQLKLIPPALPGGFSLHCVSLPSGNLRPLPGCVTHCHRPLAGGRQGRQLMALRTLVVNADGRPVTRFQANNLSPRRCRGDFHCTMFRYRAEIQDFHLSEQRISRRSYRPPGNQVPSKQFIPPPLVGGCFVSYCVTERKSRSSTLLRNASAAGLTGRHCLPALPGVTHWPWPLAT